MVVALDAKRDGDAIAGVDDPGVLSWPDQYGRSFGGQPAQVEAARLVRTVLGPHHRVHRQLQVVGLAPEQPGDRCGLVVGEPQGPVDRLISGHLSQTTPRRYDRRTRVDARTVRSAN